MIKSLSVILLSSSAVLIAAHGTQQHSATEVASPAAHPVLVELFQSQGCSSCPPANANLNAIAGQPDVVALSFSVTYWDQLGWKDSFAQPKFTARQWDYAHFNKRGGVATPQIWVNGRKTIVGDDARELAATIGRADRRGPELLLRGNRLVIGAAPTAARSADIWIARYDPRTVNVAIRAGENGGRTLPHRNLVRQLVRIGHWTGKPQAVPIPAGPPGLALAAFLQAGNGGPVLAAAKSS
ncbi:MAG: DUF1223 domain-containing protein [Sphingomicrobium sp.]